MCHKKSDKGFYTITKFADIVRMNPATLRHYDNKGAFIPAMRDTRSKNEYRLYSPMQVITVNMVRVLAGTGTSLEAVRELNQNRSTRKIQQLLRENKNRIEDDIRSMRKKILLIDTITDLLNESTSVSEKKIFISDLPEKKIVLGSINDFSNQSDFIGQYIHFFNAIHDSDIKLSFPIGWYYESMDALLKEPLQPTRFFSLDPHGNEKKEAGLYLIGHTRGNYGQVNDLPERMNAFAKKNNLAFNGPVFNIFLTDEISEVKPENYLLQVCASVKEARLTPSGQRYYRF